MARSRLSKASGWLKSDKHRQQLIGLVILLLIFAAMFYAIVSIAREGLLFDFGSNLSNKPETSNQSYMTTVSVVYANGQGGNGSK